MGREDTGKSDSKKILTSRGGGGGGVRGGRIQGNQTQGSQGIRNLIWKFLIKIYDKFDAHLKDFGHHIFTCGRGIRSQYFKIF